MEIDKIAEAAYATNTMRSYQFGWSLYVKFCQEAAADPKRPTVELIVAFLAELAFGTSGIFDTAYAFGSVSLFRSAVKWNLKSEPLAIACVEDVDVIQCMRAIGRIKRRPPKRARPLLHDQLQRVLADCDQRGRRVDERDAALLAIGFCCALRRSELCGLDVESFQFLDDIRTYVNIPQSKTDPYSRGERVPLIEGPRIRPVERLRNWLLKAHVLNGPAFRRLDRYGGATAHRLSDSAVNLIVKRRVKRVGLDPTEYSSHSLRAGFITSAAKFGMRVDKIMEVSRHTEPKTVLGYIRDEDAFRDHAAKDFI